MLLSCLLCHYNTKSTSNLSTLLSNLYIIPHHHLKTLIMNPSYSHIMSPTSTTSTSTTCTKSPCFFCILNEPNSPLRRAKISLFLHDLPLSNTHDQVNVLSVLWNLAMTYPNDPELPSLGIFNSMASLITKGVKDRDWLLTDQNIYIPYYAAHVIGSYTMNNPHFARKAVEGGAISPLMELFRGKISWVEQRVAVRALGHIASYETTFEALAEYGDEVVNLAMDLSSTCLDVVYNLFVGVKDRRRVKYHCDLLTRGIGGKEMENKKAEVWASQLQCWSLNLLNCFAYKGRCVDLICSREGFLKGLCEMWGGVVNTVSPGGFGLLRLVCYSKYGRRKVSELDDVIESLSNVSRSSDDWQYIGIDCLLLLLKDPEARPKVVDRAILALSDLIEIKCLGERSNVGEVIINVILSIKSRISKKAEEALDEVLTFLERRRQEKMMSRDKIRDRKAAVALLKKQGNESYWSGQIKSALAKYSQGLNLCPLKLRKERIALYSNRAQCNLMAKDLDGAIRDTTRALCLTDPVNAHGKSLWRRSQAYDMKGLARESFSDCVMFLNCCMKVNPSKYSKIPPFAARMISKQMEATWLFRSAALKCEDDSRNGKAGLETILEEPLKGNVDRKRGARRGSRRMSDGSGSSRFFEM